MRRMECFAIGLAALAWMPGSALAQASPNSPGPDSGFMFAGASSVGQDLGGHVGIGVRRPVSSGVAGRLEAVVSDGVARGLSTMATAEVSIMKGAYALAGAGTSYDDGVNAVWTIGGGAALPGRLNKFVLEVRYLSTNDGSLLWSLGRGW